MKKKLIICIIVVLIIVISVIVIIKNKKTDNKDEKDINWSKNFAKIITREDSFEKLDDVKIQIADLNNDDIPELFAIGYDGNENIINVFGINDSDDYSLTTSKVKQNLELEFLGNIKDGSFNWYLVDENKGYIYSLKYNNKKIEVSDTKEDIDNYAGVSSPEIIQYDDLTDDIDDIEKTLKESYSIYPKKVLNEKNADLGQPTNSFK